MINPLELILASFPDEEFLKIDGHDNAVIGVDKNLCLVYDREVIIENLMSDMSFEDALEYYEYNIESAYVGEKTPVIIELIMSNYEQR